MDQGSGAKGLRGYGALRGERLGLGASDWGLTPIRSAFGRFAPREAGWPAGQAVHSIRSAREIAVPIDSPVSGSRLVSTMTVHTGPEMSTALVPGAPPAMPRPA